LTTDLPVGRHERRRSGCRSVPLQP